MPHVVHLVTTIQAASSNSSPGPARHAIATKLTSLELLRLVL
uniref:Uncharacterized protein n=1 Tax=Physcomitrium patens TaxID=3218 RepID=A0A2K1JTX7_PHYPA|nr:hypothetical protein PHYPA_014751 [Physcomitrium patens]